MLENVRRARRVGKQCFELVLEHIDLAAERLAKVEMSGSQAHVQKLRAKRRHFETRLRMRDEPWRRWYVAPKELLLGRYDRYGVGWRSFAQDLFLLRREYESVGRHTTLWCERS